MKLHCLNLSSGSTTASPTPEVKISARKGCSLRHVIVFGMKSRFLNFANTSSMASAIPGVKNFPKRVWWQRVRFAASDSGAQGEVDRCTLCVTLG